MTIKTHINQNMRLVAISMENNKGSDEPAHICSLTRTLHTHSMVEGKCSNQILDVSSLDM